MVGLDNLIVDLMLILVGAGIVTVLFKKIKLPAVLGYIVVGILISPNMVYIPANIEPHGIEVWADIGIMFLMFGLGLEFSFHKMAKVGRSAVTMVGTAMTLMVLTGFFVGKMLGWENMNCIFLGCMMGISSTMIILKSFEELGLKHEKFAQAVLGSLVIEDIVGIFMMIVLTTLSVSKNFSGANLSKELSTLILTLVVILTVGIYVVPTVLNKIKSYINDETLLIISLGFCLLMVVILTKAGFSEALGAFLAGSILAGTSFSDRIENLINPIKNLFGAIFFVSVGQMVNPESIIQNIAPIIVITLVTICGHLVFSTVGALISGQDFRTSVRAGFSMAQVGEFSYIIAALGVSLGVMDIFVYEIIVVVSILTIFTTPILIKNGDKMATLLHDRLPGRIIEGIDRYSAKKSQNSAKDGDWMRFVKGYVIKTLVCSAILVMILILGVGFVHPQISEYVDSLAADVVISVILVFIMAPFINIMCRRNSIDFNKLWTKSSSNRVPLIIMRAVNVIISVMVIEGIISRIIVDLPMPVRIAAEFIAVILIITSDTLRGRALNLESRFVANFNEKILKMKKEEQNAGNDPVGILELMHVFEFKPLVGFGSAKIEDFVDGKKFRVVIVQIKRADGEYVNDIKKSTIVNEDDIVTVVGSRNNMEAYAIALELEKSRILNDGRIITLKEHIYRQIFNKVDIENQLVCVEIPVSRGMSFYKKRIRDNDFRKKYKGSIIGIEKNHLPILNPNPNYMLNEGDIVWALGTRIMMDEIIRSKLVTKQ